MKRLLVPILLVISLAGNLAWPYVLKKYNQYYHSRDHFFTRYSGLVHDFAGREVFLGGASEVAADVDSSTIVFFGSEIISRWDLKRDFKGLRVLNRGIEDQRVAGCLARLRPDVIDKRAKVVVIGISPYNFRPYSSVDEIQDYYVSIAELANYNEITPILMTVVPPTEACALEDWPGWIVRDSVAQFNNWLRNWSKDHNFRLADVALAVSDSSGCLRRDLAVDYMVVNRAGYTEMAKVVRSELEALLRPEKVVQQ